MVYAQKTAALDVSKIAHDVRKRIEDAIEDRDLPALLANFDDKGFLALAAKHLKGTSKTAFESWLTRATCDANSDKLKNAIGKVLPAIVAS